MKIKEKMLYEGKEYDLEYEDVNNFSKLPSGKIGQIYGACLYGDKLVIGYRGKKNTWGLIGGRPEEGEDIEETLKREIKEESNMKILKSVPIGYQKVMYPNNSKAVYQLRSYCKVKPIGNFKGDPDGSITEIKLIKPQNYGRYFNWGKIGKRIIQRAIEINDQKD